MTHSFVVSRHPNKINTNYFKKFWTTNVTPTIFFSKFTPTMWHQYNNMPENPRFWCQLIYRDKYHHALSSRHIRKVHSSMPAPTQPTNPNIWLVIFMLSKKNWFAAFLLNSLNTLWNVRFFNAMKILSENCY